MADNEDLPLFYAPCILSDGCLPQDEVAHALRVLRLSAGERIRITDGQGNLFLARINQMDRKGCTVDILESEILTRYWQAPITIAIAPTKQMERMEWLCEKMVEIGVDEIVCLRTEHSERKQLRAERLKRIAISAMKQSQKATLPRIEEGVPFADFIARERPATKLIAHCHSEQDASSISNGRQPMDRLYQTGPITIMIGPEGDFSSKEVSAAIQSGYRPLSLGSSRLRTETAALVALQWVHCLQQIDQHHAQRIESTT